MKKLYLEMNGLGKFQIGTHVELHNLEYKAKLVSSGVELKQKNPIHIRNLPKPKLKELSYFTTKFYDKPSLQQEVPV